MKIAILQTNRYYYDIVEASEDSMSVGELIDRLSRLDPDTKIVFSNDNGYTYGYITDSVVSTEDVYDDEEEEDDMACDRGEMIYNLSELVRKNEDKPVRVEAIWLYDEDDEEHEVKWLGYNDSRVLGVALDDNYTFIPIDQISDNDLIDIWDMTIRLKK